MSYSLAQIIEIYKRPLLDIIFEAAKNHRENHDPNTVQISTLLSIKTGGCPEDCAYCPQAARYHTGLEKEGILSKEKVEFAASQAKAAGSSRLCLGAAWRNVKDDADFDHVLGLVEAVNSMDLEVCCTLGMLTESQAKKLSKAGLYAYNHNLDSSDEFYSEIISTRSYTDRLKTLENVRKANLTICSGGIIGMGETIEDRCKMLFTLSLLNPIPESVPINALVPVKGTPLENQKIVSSWEIIRMIAVTRIVMPKTVVRLSAGRTEMSAETQALCFLAGAGSIFAGDKLLTTPNPNFKEDLELFEILGLKAKKPSKRSISTNHSNNDEIIINEEIEWSRPGHTIEKNKIYANKSKLKAKL